MKWLNTRSFISLDKQVVMRRCAGWFWAHARKGHTLAKARLIGISGSLA